MKVRVFAGFWTIELESEFGPMGSEADLPETGVGLLGWAIRFGRFSVDMTQSPPEINFENDDD